MFDYRLLAAILFLASLFGAGAYTGYQLAAGHYAQAAADAQEQAIEGVRQQLEIDKQAAIERVRRQTLASMRARSAVSRGVSDATLKAKPLCGRDAESMGLLNDAIAAANGTEPGARGVPQSLPAGTQP